MPNTHAALGVEAWAGLMANEKTATQKSCQAIVHRALSLELGFAHFRKSMANEAMLLLQFPIAHNT